MPSLKKTLADWNSNTLKETLAAEVISLGLDTIPLYLATEQGGLINEDSISLSILSKSEKDHYINIKAGFFFTEIVGGCNCDDDPSETNIYCVLSIKINKKTASCEFSIEDQ